VTAAFPAIEPTGRTYAMGVFSMSQAQAFAGSAVRFTHSSTPIGHALELFYADLPDAELQLIRDHYVEQEGGYLSFLLPDVIWQGFDDPEDLVPATYRWKYSAPPEEAGKPGGFYDVTVPLECVGPELGSLLDL
jgi:hypothetical protein